MNMDCSRVAVKPTPCFWMICIVFVYLLFPEGHAGRCSKDQYDADNKGDCQPCQPPAAFLEQGYCHKCLICEHAVKKNCTPSSDAECSCPPGFGCQRQHCEKCEKLPLCKKGEELKVKGNFNYKYSCQPCPNKTYSNIVNGTCKPFTECHSIGMEEVFAGNRTHNVKCGVNQPVTDDQWLNTVQALHLIGSAVIGLSCLVLLGICCLKIKSKRSQSANQRPVVASEPGLLPFSVEERGATKTLPDTHL
ncbi:tumor necrosis factor receptor superfamily member 18 [Engraulis encrasicolus]|uniref:tumor necrosis factor receptor superfamily member 18 n=1 Tax=Engraulis encrasicolus TaxID=184585 RepID=UPI002FD0B1FF